MGYQKMGEIALKGSNKRRKNVFFLLGGVRIQGGFWAIYPAQILTIFETTDVNRCPGGDRLKNFQISAQGVLRAPKMQFLGVFG